MGPATDTSSVVSDELKVHGVENLRVIDASVMPSMPSANTYSATMVIAEKGSDMIRGKAAPAPVALPALPKGEDGSFDPAPGHHRSSLTPRSYPHGTIRNDLSLPCPE